MSAAWRRGERPGADEFLARAPLLAEHPQAAVRLIYEEICLRQEAGEEVAPEEVLGRFARWREELALLLDCHDLLQANQAETVLPAVGETLGDFRLLAVLGQGRQGVVFLASQQSLGGGPVVLKVSPCTGAEHLALARLQHTHIVPLFSAHDFPDRGLRALCLPYLGGTTLARLLEHGHEYPPHRRTGQHLLAALDESGEAVPVPSRGPGRQALRRASYAQAVCRIGACLADALHYAHEHGLVHLDVKPSNVLLAADAQPMLLDFHLAHEPLHPDGPVPERLGGTPGYMSPEQEEAARAVSAGRPIPTTVDCRSDLYSLGLVLYEALGGTVAAAGPDLARLRRVNPQVSVGLADLLGKCLAPDPRDRYPDAAALAGDLRRHLADLPLKGAANRSLAERWAKWRRRRPTALALLGLMLAAVLVLSAGGALALSQTRQRLRQARTALADGQEQLQAGRYAVARRTLTRGLEVAEDRRLSEQIQDRLQLTRRLEAAQRLHLLADRVRFLCALESLPAQEMRSLESSCRSLWAERSRLTASAEPRLDPAAEQGIRTDLLDLAVVGADLHVRLAPPERTAQARRHALKLLAQAEALFGPGPVLARERQVHAEALGLAKAARKAARQASRLSPRTAWEHYALGRSLLGAGRLVPAAAAFARSLRRQPQHFWPQFYQGVCAYRLGHHQEAIASFSVCIALAPHSAPCRYNRALAHEASGGVRQALHDYDRALQLDPSLAVAALNRGALYFRQQCYGQALADLHRALDKGADPATVHYNLALVHLKQHEQAAAQTNLRRALQYNATHKEARALYERLWLDPSGPSAGAD